MNRRAFLSGGCACGAMCVSGLAAAQFDWQAPPRFARPEASTDEAGLWSIMDREETRLRRSPFVLRDADLQTYVQGIACRLAGDHCPDLRVHIVRTPLFNASMAPNGMMEVWTGLLLRVENEAQLAGVLGHEIAHYLLRHSVERLRAIKSAAAANQILALFGLVGAVGQLAVLAGVGGYGRDHEREADRIGLALAQKAGYDPLEIPKVWANLLLEIRARPDGEQNRAPLFATHPPSEERQQELQRLAEATPGGNVHGDAWQSRVKPHLRDWLTDEIKRGQHDESIALLTRMIKDLPQADYPYARGEIYRLRGGDGDLDAALADYQAAIEKGSEPAETYRGMGAIYRIRKQPAEAKSSLQRYLELAPNAPDSSMIRSYLEEIGI